MALRLAALLVLLLVLGQIALGGWVSSNYAALMCQSFPECRPGEWLPQADFAQAFQWHRELGRNAEGELLPAAALTAIHLVHRAGALVVALAVGLLAVTLRRRPGLKSVGTAMLLVLALQISLGVTNVLASLPLPVAVGHNAGAALLLATLVIAIARLGSRPGYR